MLVRLLSSGLAGRYWELTVPENRNPGVPGAVTVNGAGTGGAGLKRRRPLFVATTPFCDRQDRLAEFDLDDFVHGMF